MQCHDSFYEKRRKNFENFKLVCAAELANKLGTKKKMIILFIQQIIANNSTSEDNGKDQFA